MATTLRSEAIQKRLIEMKERVLTLNIVIPIFKAIGYERVEYSGGPTEDGKDIICWRTNEIAEPELAVGQVKRYKPSKRARDSRSFSEIVTQLSQSLEKPVESIDGLRRLPETVYFITPYTVDSLTLRSRFEGYQSLRSRRVRIIDGPKLAQLLELHLPELIPKITGSTLQITSVIANQLTNQALLGALHVAGARRVDSFYTDIDLSLGHPALRTFFSASFSAAKIIQAVSESEWARLRRLEKRTLKHLSAGFLRSTDAEAASTFKKLYRDHEQWEMDVGRLRQSYRSILAQAERLETALAKRVRELKSEEPVVYAIYEAQENILKRIRRLAEAEEQKRLSSQAVKRSSAALARELRDVRKQLQGADPDFARMNVELAGANEAGYSLRSQIVALESAEPTVTFPAEITGEDITKALLHEREKILSSIANFNNRHPSTATLRRFLLHARGMFHIARAIFSERILNPALGPQLGKQAVGITPPSTRLEISIHSIIDTGINISLFGEAGAGKTTSLQMYAFNKLHEEPERLVIFAPLSALIRAWIGEKATKVGPTDAKPLLHGLCAYLRSLQIHISTTELEEALRKPGTVLLLDGVDEVIKSAPWIIASTKSLNEYLPGVQVVTSSRVTGDYVNQFDSLAVNLLPFKDDQRTKFFEKWFGHAGKHQVTKITKHLSRRRVVGEIVRNPLLATILCVLAENQVPLPNSEIRLYDERMQLLLGRYDLHKNVSRIKTHSSTLMRIAQKIAFQLHAIGQRDGPVDVFIHWTQRDLHPHVSRRDARVGVNELIDPCNVLVPMTEDGMFGFGHLRYQEYLAARELVTNRGVSLSPLLVQEWWHGAMVLFAQMNESIEWLVEELASSGELHATKAIIKKMIAESPANERAYLRQIVNANAGLDIQLPEEGWATAGEEALTPFESETIPGNEDLEELLWRSP